MQTTMRALRAHERGGSEKLRLEEIAIPEPRHDEVLVRVHAAGILFTELSWDATWGRDGQPRVPITPAHEVSGTVAAIGAGVSHFHLGDEVFGMVPFDEDGAAADFVRTPARYVALKPRSLGDVVAAALPISGLTAYEALVDRASLRSGERVLILGGAGAVGSLAIQLARAFGAQVTATARKDDVHFVRGMGAQEVVDLDDFDKVPAIYDVVVDGIGGDVPWRSIRTLRTGGRLICLTAPAPKPESGDVTAEFFVVSPQPSVLTELALMYGRGELKVEIAAVFPLERGAAAYASGAIRPRRPGKTVIVVQD